MAVEKLNQPPELWDRLFAPSSCLAVITTVDGEGRVNAASFGTCTRVKHEPVYIAFTTSVIRDTARNLLANGEFTVNLPKWERASLEKVRVCGLAFAPGVNELEKAAVHRHPIDERRAAPHPAMPSAFRVPGGVDQGMVGRAPDGVREARGSLGRCRLRRCAGLSRLGAREVCTLLRRALRQWLRRSLRDDVCRPAIPRPGSGCVSASRGPARAIFATLTVDAWASVALGIAMEPATNSSRHRMKGRS